MPVSRSELLTFCQALHGHVGGTSPVQKQDLHFHQWKCKPLPQKSSMHCHDGRIPFARWGGTAESLCKARPCSNQRGTMQPCKVSAALRPSSRFSTSMSCSCLLKAMGTRWQPTTFWAFKIISMLELHQPQTGTRMHQLKGL